MWKCRFLTRLLLWKNSSKLQQHQQNAIPWIVWRSFSVGHTDTAGTHGFVPPRQFPTGSTYGKLTGIGRNTLKMDIMHFFEGCGLALEDIKVAYNRSYSPLGMILKFSTRTAYATAIRTIAAKGRQYRLQEADPAQWNGMTSFDGKVLLLSGIPRQALLDDVERFLSGFNSDGSSIQFFVRPQFEDEPVRHALVKCRTANDAMNILRQKNRSFCLNNPITIRLLQ